MPNESTPVPTVTAAPGFHEADALRTIDLSDEPGAIRYAVGRQSRELLQLDGSPLPILDGEIRMSEATRAIQRALDSGAEVRFPPGVYLVDRLFVRRSHMTLTFARGAILCPVTREGGLVVEADHVTLRGLQIHQQPFEWGDPARYTYRDVGGAVHSASRFGLPRPRRQDVLLTIGRGGDDCTLHDLSIECSSRTDAMVHVYGVTKVRFFGGRLFGGASRATLPSLAEIEGDPTVVGAGTGLRLGSTDVDETGGIGELLCVGLSVTECWYAPVHFCANAPFDEPTFLGCNFEQALVAGVLVRPFTPKLDASGTQTDSSLEIKSLNLIGCHFEGLPAGVVVASAFVRGGTVTGTQFGLYRSTMVSNSDSLPLTEGAIFDVVGHVDLTVSGFAQGAFAEPRHLGNVSIGLGGRHALHSSQVVRTGAAPGAAIFHPPALFQQVSVSGCHAEGPIANGPAAFFVWRLGRRADLVGTLDMGNRWPNYALLSHTGCDCQPGLGFEANPQGPRRALVAEHIAATSVHLSPLPAPTAPTPFLGAQALGGGQAARLEDVQRLTAVVEVLRRELDSLRTAVRDAGGLRTPATFLGWR